MARERQFRRPLLLLAALVLAGAAPVMYVWRTAPMPAKENATVLDPRSGLNSKGRNAKPA